MMNIECAVTARNKAYPLKMGEFYDTEDSKMIENGVDLPTINLKSVIW
jgi:hypothetical protein